jgi:predicted glycosyltransferase involved in capsule biosynthesis
MMISIIVPYRDRSEHLAEFLEAMLTIKQDKELIIVEQEEGKPFNRGKLLNIGAIYSTGTHLIMHDVDMIPLFTEYPAAGAIIQLASSDIQTSGYLGGVTMFNSDIFFNFGGYSNNFFSRGEDNEIRFHIMRQPRIPIIIEHFHRFRVLNHARPAVEFDPVLWAKAQRPRFQDGVEYCKFQILESIESKNFKMLKVSI